jgi:hypothetical protein
MKADYLKSGVFNKGRPIQAPSLSYGHTEQPSKDFHGKRRFADHKPAQFNAAITGIGNCFQGLARLILIVQHGSQHELLYGADWHLSLLCAGH